MQGSAPVRLKTVVRRLPPNLPEAVFWQTVEPWVSEESVSWKAFYPGKLRKRPNKENIPSRAYILFKDEESLASFGREYDGHLFRDKQGNESQAVVEFAPNQKVPPEKKKIDGRHATYHQDEDYLSFVAALQNPQTRVNEVDVEALLASTQPPEEPKTTPLLSALREQKSSSHEKKLAASEATKPQAKKAVVVAPSDCAPQGKPSSQRRNRPILGLQSRHLKVALNGVGVMAPSTSLSGSSPASDVRSPQPVANAGRSSGNRSGMTGEADSGERPNEKGGKDLTAKNVGGGRGGGKERGRSRHTPASLATGSGPGTDATPRILSRQDPSASLLKTGEPLATGTTQGSATGRGRGGRRARGQNRDS